MLPNFLIIGAPKAASSWLVHGLAQHPDVFMYQQREVHYFDAHFDRGVQWYESHFRGWRSERAVGEKSPQYMSHPEAIGRIHATLGPDVRLIATLRHPVDRAYSDYWHSMRAGHIPPYTDFSTALREHAHLLERGLYGKQLQHCRAHFPPDRFLILIYEELDKDPAGTLRKCYDFLGVDPSFRAGEVRTRTNSSRDVGLLSRYAVAARRQMSRLPPLLRDPIVAAGRSVYQRIPTQRTYAPLAPQLRQELLTLFQEDVSRLEEQLDRSLGLWYTPVAL